jgi:hypothetical protein
LGEKSCCRDGAESLLYDADIVMGVAEESLSSPATAEQQGSERRIHVFRSVRSQEKMQVVACRLRIAQVELHSLALLNDVSDCYGSGLLVCPDEVSNEEVSSLEMTPVFNDHDSQVQCAMSVSSMGSGRDTTEFVNQILFGSGHDKPFADRPAALRGHGSHGDRSGELHSHHASVEHLIVEE